MLNLNPATTAVVLIDLQKGLLGLPLAPYAATQVVGSAVRLAKKVTTTGGTVVLVRVDFGDGLAAAPRGQTDTPLAIPAGGIPADWSEIAPDLLAIQPCLTVTKHNWSAFYGTNLDLQLRRRGISHIILGGLMTNFGVESTARDGWQHNYTVVVAEDACGSFNADLHGFAIANTLPRVSLVRKSSEIIAALDEKAHTE